MKMWLSFQQPLMAGRKYNTTNTTCESSDFQQSDSIFEDEETWKPEVVVKKRKYTRRVEVKPKVKVLS